MPVHRKPRTRTLHSLSAESCYLIEQMPGAAETLRHSFKQTLSGFLITPSAKLAAKRTVPDWCGRVEIGVSGLRIKYLIDTYPAPGILTLIRLPVY
jgi:hypothetical protein